MDTLALTNAIETVESKIELQELVMNDSKLSDVGVIYNSGILKGYKDCLVILQQTLELEMESIGEDIDASELWDHDSFGNDFQELEF